MLMQGLLIIVSAVFAYSVAVAGRYVLTQHDEKQGDLARLLGVTAATISKWETGTYEMDQATLKIMADHYNVSIDYLLGYDYDLKRLPLREQRLVKFYRNLSTKQKELIEAIINSLDK
jgi:transcriptional regulator with XRE-family HTH domain